jgi:hypothetical protein
MSGDVREQRKNFRFLVLAPGRRGTLREKEAKKGPAASHHPIVKGLPRIDFGLFYRLYTRPDSRQAATPTAL